MVGECFLIFPNKSTSVDLSEDNQNASNKNNIPNLQINLTYINRTSFEL